MFASGRNHELSSRLHQDGEAEQSAQALQASERLLREIQEISWIGTYRWNIKEDSWISGPIMDRIFGIGDDYPRTMEGWIQLVLPEFQGKMRDYIAFILREHHPFDLDYPILRPLDGQVRWLHGGGEIQWDEQGEPIQMVGVIQDITERKQAEQALQESEYKYRALVETTGTGYVIVDTEGRVLDANQEYVRLTGHEDLDQILGRTVMEWTAPHDLERNAQEVQKCLQRGSVHGLEVDYVDGQGRITPIEIDATVISSPQGSKVLTLCKDITKRRQDEQALRESESRFRAIFQNASLGIIESSLKGRFLSANPAFLAFIGYEEAELLKLSFTEITHPDHLALDLAKVQNCLHGELPFYETEKRYIRKDGKVVWGRIFVTLARDPEGCPKNFIGFIQDLTEIRQADAERRRLEEEIQHSQRLESLGSLAGGVAHDMNNVLAAIQGMASLLRETTEENPTLWKRLDTILHAAERGRNLVKNLTDFARKGVEEPRPLDLNEILRREVDLLSHTTLQRIELKLDLEDPLPKISGDPSSVGNALMNLCINSVDAMPQGGVLQLGTRTLSEGFVELFVQDTGHGMPPEVLARALEPYFTTKPVGKGSGIGLSSVYGAVKAHGGTIEIASEVDHGTTVRLRFPCLSCETASETQHEATEGVRSQKSLRLFLVDDDPIIRETFPALAEALGHQVIETAVDGLEALQCLSEGLDVEAVILDHNMPRLSGMETLVRIHGLYPDLAVVVSSGYVDDELQAIVESHDRLWVLPKPYTLREVRKILNEVALS